MSRTRLPGPARPPTPAPHPAPLASSAARRGAGSQRLAAGLLAAAIALATSACGAVPGLSPPPTITPAAALAPVPTPILADAAPPMRTQVAAAFAQAAALEAQPGVAPLAMAEAQGQLGQLLLAYDYPAAEPALRNAAALAPQDPRWPHLLGLYFKRREQPGPAAEAFAAALALAPEDLALRHHLAEVYLDLGRLDEARQALDLILRRDADSAYAHYLLGELADAEDDPATAVTHYETALRLQPGASRLQYLLGMAYRQLGDTAASERALALRGEAGPTLGDPLMEQLEALPGPGAPAILQATALLQANRPADARQVAEQAVAADPTDGEAQRLLGLARQQLGDAAGALAALREAVRLAPDSATAHTSLGLLLYAERQYEAAEAAFRQSIALDPQLDGPFASLGEILQRSGRCEEAVGLFERATRLAPSNLRAHIELALCRYRTGRLAEAREGLEAALAGNPGQPDLSNALARLLAAAPDEAQRDGPRAVQLAESVAGARDSVDSFETRALAYAAVGRMEEAVAMQDQALARARAEGREAWAQELAANLERLKAGEAALKPWPETLFQLP